MVLQDFRKLIMPLSLPLRVKLIYKIGLPIWMRLKLPIQDARNVLFTKDSIMLSKELKVMLERISKLWVLSSEELRSGLQDFPWVDLWLLSPLWMWRRYSEPLTNFILMVCPESGTIHLPLTYRKLSHKDSELCTMLTLLPIFPHKSPSHTLISPIKCSMMKLWVSTKFVEPKISPVLNQSSRINGPHPTTIWNSTWKLLQLLKNLLSTFNTNNDL